MIQSGAFSNAFVAQLGSSNNSLIFQSGDGTTAAEANSAVVNQTGAGHNSLVVQVGHGNLAAVIQN